MVFNMYKISYNKKIKFFQNKGNLLEYLKNIIKYNKDNIHYCDTLHNINIMRIDNKQILIKWIGNNETNKNIKLFHYIRNNTLHMKSEIF